MQKRQSTNNSQSDRLAAMGEPTAAELSAVRQAYQRHLEACARVGCPPEGFLRFFAEWRDTCRAPDDPATAVDPGPSRDYSQIYHNDLGSDHLVNDADKRRRDSAKIRERAKLARS